MKPYLRTRKIKGSNWKRDYRKRPKKHWDNWWESMNTLISRRKFKQKQKRLIIEIMQADEKDGLYDV